MSQFNQKGLLISLLVTGALCFMTLPVQADSVKSCIEVSSTNLLSDSEVKVIQLSDPLEVTFSWNPADPDAHFDIYIALQSPSEMGEQDIQLSFLDVAGHFHQTVESYLTDQQAWDGKITVLKYEELPFENVRLDQFSGMIGLYAFYAVVVPEGTEKENVLNPDYWISDLCSDMFFVTRTR
ncbi:MAG: hypothetical protein DRR16_01160 [Candidatus Parabeggiatoa sp. nov. 3]|nr:MAG: hypothetical protein DRR00_00780 [Gammaproteobacteria bacterium]RKZ69761.1 MAG: hypothetical protein DRQ99_00200 [Gammaproteobacteria bacterium]RKZ89925.1 MAG: hypothetical protein DRR16_01160 [Gammaproteobacteria bacterium]